MTAAADLVLTNAAVHGLEHPDPIAEAVAVRDGRIVRVGNAYDVEFLAGAETRVLDLEGAALLPGFVDAHTHLELVGRRRVHADLGDAESRSAALDRLGTRAAATDDDAWVLGYGYDETAWDDAHRLRRGDLDRVSTDRPVVAFREDLHTASLNGVALTRLRDRMPEADVVVEDGRPTGVVVETALDAVFEATAPDRAETRDLLMAARDACHRHGITGVHEMVRDSHAPAVYRALATADDLDLRVRLNYWVDHLDAVLECGLQTNAGGPLVRTGAIKTYTDGSFGARTAKLRESYAGGDEGDTGQWVVDPATLQSTAERVAAADLQMATHAIGDAAIETTLDAYAVAEPGDRFRIEHAELLPEDLFERVVAAATDERIVVSAQPNFHRWAGDDGLYERLLGDRAALTNRFGDLAAAGVELAFGSDCMPLGPLYGIRAAVDAPTPGQRLDVTTALRAYTYGGARAGFDEDRVGAIVPGRVADLVALAPSPWTALEQTAPVLTVVDGRVVRDERAD